MYTTVIVSRFSLGFSFFFLMIRRPPRSTRTDTPFPTRRSSDLAPLNRANKAAALRNNQIASRTVGVGCEGRNNRLHFHADTAPAACERGDFSLFAFSCHLAQRLAFIAFTGTLSRHFLFDFVQTGRSEEHTYAPQTLMRISYAVFCLKKKKST